MTRSLNGASELKTPGNDRTWLFAATPFGFRSLLESSLMLISPDEREYLQGNGWPVLVPG
jgi:hypothetical protein